jgi:hypothetical protein
MIRESDALTRKQMFLICRYTLIFATGALAFAETVKDASPLPVMVLVVTALASNIVLSHASPFSFFDAWLQAPVLVADTAMISSALLLSRANQESFFFFFFVLIMAAKVENLAMLATGAGLIGFASFLLADPGHTGWASPTLMRVPFMFAASVFFGYVVLPERNGQMSGFNTPSPLSRLKQSAPKPAPMRRRVMQEIG